MRRTRLRPLVFLLGLAVCALFGPVDGLADEKADTKKSKTLKRVNTEKSRTLRKGKSPRKLFPKVERFLRDVLKVRSFEEVGRRFKMANFSKQELDQLEKQLKKSPYSSKLHRLGKKSESAIKAKTKARVQQITKQKQRTFVKRKEQRLKHLNKNAQTMFAKLKKSAASKHPSMVTISTTFTTTMKAKISFEDTAVGRAARESRRRWASIRLSLYRRLPDIVSPLLDMDLAPLKGM